MRVEVDDDEPAAGRERPGGFFQRAGRIVEEMQHLMDDDEIVAVALDRGRVDVALAQMHVAQSALIDAAPGQRQHRRALVDADSARGVGRQQFEHPSRSRAEIEQAAIRLRADHRHERRLDPLLRRVQGANPVPVRRLLGEIGRRLPAPGLARDLEPSPIGAERRIGRIQPADDVAGESAARVGEAEEGPGALALSGGEAGLNQKFQVARDARLRLAEDGDQLADGQFGLLEQAKDPEPRLLARRLEIGEQSGKGNRRRRHARSRHKHIFMSKPTKAQGTPHCGAGKMGDAKRGPNPLMNKGPAAKVALNRRSPRFRLKNGRSTELGPEPRPAARPRIPGRSAWRAAPRRPRPRRRHWTGRSGRRGGS